MNGVGTILGAFTKLRKGTFTFLMSVRMIFGNKYSVFVKTRIFIDEEATMRFSCTCCFSFLSTFAELRKAPFASHGWLSASLHGTARLPLYGFS
jgi:hypothetical protein